MGRPEESRAEENEDLKGLNRGVLPLRTSKKSKKMREKGQLTQKAPPRSILEKEKKGGSKKKAQLEGE